MTARDLRKAERGGPDRWTSHRGWSLLVRVAVSLVPVACALLVGELVARALGEPTPGSPVVLWWAAVLAATVTTVLVVERAARRLLPLSTLLRLSLVFPDRAPSRFRVALRASTVRRAERALERSGDDRTPAGQAAAALALVVALHAHDRRTRGHSERVRALTVMVGREMGLGSEELDRLEWAGLLHDIGKLRVPGAILNKAGPPDDEEWSILRRHPGDGGVFMAPLCEWLGTWVHGVDQHHENFDGSGYPLGLAGDDIALSGRIVAVTDALETMTAARAYKRPLPVTEARAELVACAGAQFDPSVVRATLTLSVPRLVLALGPLAALLQVPLVSPMAGTLADLQGAMAVAAAATPRAVATAALVLGTLGGGPAGILADAGAQVPGAVGVEPPRSPGGDHPAPSSSGRGATATATSVAVPPASADDDPPGAAQAGGRGGDVPAAAGVDGSGGSGAWAPGTDDPGGARPASPPTTAPPVTTPPAPSPPATNPPPASPPPPNPPGLPAAALACLDGGWVALGFPNQGQCISAALHG